VNEAPAVSLSNLVMNLAEDTPTAGSVKIADIVINDDALGTNNLTLAGADAAHFEIVGGNELHLKAGTALDFETQSSYDVTVAVDDAGVGGTPDDSVAHTLTLTDVNEAPVVADQSISIGEFTVNGTSVATLVASDVDAGDSLTYSITAGNTNGAFAIDPVTGEITVANVIALDFDINPVFVLGVQVQDTNGLTNTAALTVTLNAMLDSPVDDDPTDDPTDEPVDEPVPDDGPIPHPEPEPEVEATSDPVPEDSPSELPLNRVRLTSSGVSHEDSEVASSTASERPSRDDVGTDSDTATDAGATDEGDRLILLRERATWDGLNMLGDQISEDSERQQAEIDRTTARIEGTTLAISTGLLALFARGSSLIAMLLSSLPIWLRVDPLSVLLLSERDRKKREGELLDAEILEDETGRLGDLLEGPTESGHDQAEKDPGTDDEEIAGT
jgi:hypothetical protein